jgi:hypothetical protein
MVMGQFEFNINPETPVLVLRYLIGWRWFLRHQPTLETADLVRCTSVRYTEGVTFPDKTRGRRAAAHPGSRFSSFTYAEGVTQASCLTASA